MSSADFETVLVKDDRLMATDKLGYAVEIGGSNVVQQIYEANSQSATSITFSLQTPSLETVMDRRVLVRSSVVLQCTGTAPAGQFLIDYGMRDALAPFPLSQLLTNTTVTINNQSSSISTKDVLASIMRFHDKRDLHAFNGMTPCQPDFFQAYQDGIGASNNALGAYANTASENDYSPRGSWVLDFVSSTAPPVITPLVPSTGASQTIWIGFTVTEPLWISPFTWAQPKSGPQGMYGIQSMNVNMTLGPCNRAWRCAPFVPSAGTVAKAFTVFSVNNSQLLVNYLTRHPSDVAPARNVLSWYETPRYITGNLPAVASGGSATIRTQNIQLNQIPDSIIVYCRKVMGNQTPEDADFALAIQNCTVSFNNQNGLLSTAVPQQLYNYSRESGSNQTWYEFSGRASNHDPSFPGGKVVPTSGSYLCLKFGKHIQINEAFYAPGSLANANLQITLNVFNQSATNFGANDLEIVLITVNSGLYVLERGTASIYSGILTKSDVLDAQNKEPHSSSDAQRMVGYGLFDSLKSVAGMVLPKLPSLAKAALSMSGHPLAKAGVAGLSALGYAKPPRTKLSAHM